MDNSAIKSNIIKELSKTFPKEIVDALITNYENILIEYRKGCWDETLCKGGKFAENAFRLLSFLADGKVEKEAPSFKDVREKLEKTPSNKLPDSVRILIPRICSSFIYDPRSKKSAVHVKEISPDYMDANLIVVASSWVLAEFIRLYHTAEPKDISEIINNLIQRKVPFIETRDGKVFVTKPIDCPSEILLLLLNYSNGFSRNKIGEVLGKYYTAVQITRAVQGLEKERLILKVNNNYVISGPGEDCINSTLSKIL